MSSTRTDDAEREPNRDRGSDDRDGRDRNPEREHERDRTPTIEPGYDYVSLYVYEAGTNELLEVVYEAETLALPAVGDRLSFTEARAEGDLEERAVSYHEEREPPRYVVEEREVTYLHVDCDVEGVEEDRQLVSEVRVWVREVDDREPDG